MRSEKGCAVKLSVSVNFIYLVPKTVLSVSQYDVCYDLKKCRILENLPCDTGLVE